MELFVESGQNYTFLLELILAYLKLEERNSVKLIRLSEVHSNPCRLHSMQLKEENSILQYHLWLPLKVMLKLRSFKFAKDFSKYCRNGEPSFLERVMKQTKLQELKANWRKERS